MLKGSGKKTDSEPSRPISAGKAKAKGCEERDIDPKGPKMQCSRGQSKTDSKPSRPRSAGKAEAKGCEKKSYRSERSKMRLLRGRQQSSFKNIVGRYRSGRLSQRDVKKELSAR